jgi:hypothetical protein
MTTVLETRETSFIFYSPSYIEKDNKDEYCTVFVSVRKLKYKSGKMYYDVSYKYNYSHNTSTVKEANPLFNIDNDDGDSYKGDIIAVNSLSDQLINYLMMPFNELAKYSGSVMPSEYKISIIKSINLFWD